MLLITIMNLLTVTSSGLSKIFLQELGDLIKSVLQISCTFKKMDWDPLQLMGVLQFSLSGQLFWNVQPDLYMSIM